MKTVAFALVGLFVCVSSLVPDAQRNALLLLYYSTEGTSWNNQDNWLEGDPCVDSWYGISCDSDTNVQSVRLSKNNLRGSLPSEMNHLTFLDTLDLSYNYELNSTLPDSWSGLVHLRDLNLSYSMIRGSLPESWSGLANLENLDLSYNSIGGTLPESWSEIATLKNLYLYNMNIVGTLPDSWSGLVNLQELYLWGNMIEGTLPDSWRVLVNLQDLDLSSNLIEGSLPESWSELASLNYLRLSDNEIDSFLPASWRGLVALQYLYLLENKIQGTLPESWSELVSLQILYLSNLNIVGTLPDSWSALVNLRELFLLENKIEGTLPDSWGGLVHLQTLDLSSNLIEGSLPESWSELASMDYLFLSNNMIEGTLPESWNNSRISRLVVDNNKISGTLPYSWYTMPNLGEISLAENALSGYLPGGWGFFQSLSSVNLRNNLLEGPIPEEWGKLRVFEMDLRYNRLTGFLPNWLQTDPCDNFPPPVWDCVLLYGNLFYCPLPDWCGDSICGPCINSSEAVDVEYYEENPLSYLRVKLFIIIGGLVFVCLCVIIAIGLFSSFKHMKTTHIGDKPFRQLLFKACESGDDYYLKDIKPNFVNIQNSTGDSLLHVACSGKISDLEKRKKVVLTLLGVSGINVNIQNYDKITPLHYACKAGDIEIVKLLIDREDINVNLRDKQQRYPLDEICFENKASGKAVAKLMLAKQAEGMLPMWFIQDLEVRARRKSLKSLKGLSLADQLQQSIPYWTQDHVLGGGCNGIVFQWQLSALGKNFPTQAAVKMIYNYHGHSTSQISKYTKDEYLLLNQLEFNKHITGIYDHCKFAPPLNLILQVAHPSVLHLLAPKNHVTKKRVSRTTKFLILEFFEQGSLQHYLDTNPSATRRLQICRDVCSAISFLFSHRIVHCDVKLDNFVVSKANIVALCDFGCALQFPDDTMEDTIAYKGGNLIHTAPEVHNAPLINGFKTVSYLHQPSWELGLLFYEIAFGTLPVGDDQSTFSASVYQAWRLAQSRKGLVYPQEFVRLITQCLSVNPHERPSVAEIYHVVNDLTPQMNELVSVTGSQDLFQ